MTVAQDRADGLTAASQAAYPKRLAHRLSKRRCGRWLVLHYQQSFRSQPTRPVLRAIGHAGRIAEAILPAAVFGTAQWIGFLPADIREYEIVIFEAHPEDFRLLCEDEVGLFSLHPILGRRGLRHLFRFWAYGWLLVFSKPNHRISYLPNLFDFSKFATFAKTRRRPLEPNGLDWLNTGTIIEFVTFVANPGDFANLASTIASLRDQLVAHWRLVIVADDAISVPLQQVFANLCDARISFVEMSIATNVGIRFDSNTALIGFLEPGDLLSEEAMPGLLGQSESISLGYTDSIIMGTEGKAETPKFKPDWSPEYLLSEDYIGGLWLAAPDVAAMIMPRIVRQPQRMTAELTNFSLEFARSGHVLHVRRPLLLRHQRSVSQTQVTAAPAIRKLGSMPKVSIVVPTRDGLALLRRTIETVRQCTTYPNYEIIIVDNGSIEPSTAEYLDRLLTERSVSVVVDAGDFNFSRLINGGVSNACGEIVVLLNNDTYIIAPRWLEELVYLALHPANGAIGAKLLYPDGTIQHAGVVLGLGGYAGHYFRNRSGDAQDHLGRLAHVHEVSAVTGACLAVTRKNYDEVGGFDEGFAVNFNDIDFCLRLRQRGLRNVWTPHAVLGHIESASRGMKRHRSPQLRDEARRFRERWDAAIANDPYFHPVMALRRSEEKLE